MSGFELGHKVDAVSVVSSNAKTPGPGSQAVYIVFAAYPVILAAYMYVLAASQIALGTAYWFAAAINYGAAVNSYVYSRSYYYS